MPSPKIKTEVKLLMSEAIIAKKAEQVAIVAEKMKAAASIVVVTLVDLQLTKIQFFVVIFVNQALNLKLSKTLS